MRTRTVCGAVIPVEDVSEREAATVPFWLAKTFGSTDTVTIDGVRPLEGDTVMPAVPGVRVKGVLPPPGSVMVKVCRVTLRLQKLPRKTISSAEACTRGYEFREPTGST